MSGAWQVDLLALRASGEDWTDQGSRLRTARHRLADASTAGFTGQVAARAATWTSVWAGAVGGVADRAEGIAERLRDAADAYLAIDTAAQDRFRQWLGGPS